MRYLVDVPPPPDGAIDVQGLAARSRKACEAVSGEGTPVRLLRTVFVPDDGSCLLVFEARDPSAVRSASERAGVSIDRVAEAIKATADGGFPRSHETRRRKR